MESAIPSSHQSFPCTFPHSAPLSTVVHSTDRDPSFLSCPIRPPLLSVHNARTHHRPHHPGHSHFPPSSPRSRPPIRSFPQLNSLPQNSSPLPQFQVPNPRSALFASDDPPSQSRLSKAPPVFSIRPVRNLLPRRPRIASTMNSSGQNDVSPEAMQARIQQARREAENLKDRIKRKKDELADTTRELMAPHRQASIIALLERGQLALPRHIVRSPRHSPTCSPLFRRHRAPCPTTTAMLTPTV